MGPEILRVTAEPFQREGAAAITDHRFEHSFPSSLVKRRSREQDLSETRLSPSGLKFRDLLQMSPIFIAAGKKIKSILNGTNALLPEELSDLRADPLHVLDGSQQEVSLRSIGRRLRAWSLLCLGEAGNDFYEDLLAGGTANGILSADQGNLCVGDGLIAIGATGRKPLDDLLEGLAFHG
jgi:hypothetical protein